MAPRFEYECSEGHWMVGPNRLTACWGLVNGRPCAGVLTEVKQRGGGRK